MKVSREDAVNLLVAIGFKSADNWPDERIVRTLNDLENACEEDIEEVEGTLDDDEQKELFKSILEANNVEDVIELEGSEDPEEEEEEEEEEKEEPDPEEEDEEEEESSNKPKKKGKKEKDMKTKTKEKKGSASKNGKPKVGVIATIIECLTGANEKKPTTKDKILGILTKRFPDRKPESMKSTVNAQVPTGLKAEKNLTVKKNDKGYWLPSKK